MQLAVRYVIFLAAAAVSGQALPDVVMNLSYEGLKNYVIDFKLTSDVFKSFYQCLCTEDTSSCHMPYDYTHTVQSVRRNSTATEFMSPCKLYTCGNSGQSTSVICTSLGQADTCARQVKPTFVSVVDLASSCSASCVGIAWNLNNENLTVNNQQLQVRRCGSPCCSGVASVEPPQQNESSYVWVYESVNQDGYTQTYIVAGIGGGVVLIAIVVFLICLLLKSRTGSSPRQREVTNITQGSTNGTNHSFYPNNAVIHTTPALTSDAGKDTNIKIQPANPFAGFGLTKAKQTNHYKYKDTGDKPVHHKLDNQIQASGNRLFNRKSNKSDGHNHNVSDDNAGYHDFHGDYAEIDECQIQDPDQIEYIPDSSETDPNDGYSTVDNSDYYNINEAAPDSVDGNYSEPRERSEDVLTSKEASINKEPGQGLQTTTRKNFNIPVPARNVSEYSVAAAISDGASTYSMGQQMEGSSSDHRFTLEPERDNASDNDSGDRKRNSYFILEKETDEDDI